MPGRTALYGFINAKLRTRLGKLLSDQLLDSIRNAESLEAGISHLAGTAYGGIAGSLETIEADILFMEISDLAGIVSILKGPAIALGNALMVRHETDLLKRVFRCIFTRSVMKQEPYDPLLDRITGLFPHLKLEELLDAADFNTAQDILSETPYATIIEGKKSDVLLSGSLFPLETALDRYYFSTLLASIEKLPPRDRDIAGRITGIEIDIENISLICRLAGLYPSIPDITQSMFIPGGRKTRSASLVQTVRVDQSLDSLGSYIGSLYPGFDALLSGGKSRGSISGRLALFDSVLESIMDREIRALLLGNPFTIGILEAYTILKRREFRRLISALNSAAYGGKAGLS